MKLMVRANRRGQTKSLAGSQDISAMILILDEHDRNLKAAGFSPTSRNAEDRQVIPLRIRKVLLDLIKGSGIPGGSNHGEVEPSYRIHRAPSIATSMLVA